MEQQTILVYGNSLLAAGVAAQLDGVAGLRVERVGAAGVHRDTCPLALVFDLSGVTAETVLGWLTGCQQLTLIGLDLRRSQVIVLSSRTHRIGSLGDLVGLVRGQAAGGGEEPVV